MASPIKSQIQDDMKVAMRAQEKARLAAIRLILAAIKQKEVDDRIELTDEHVLAILDKMTKQRRESIAQFQQASRHDLAEQEIAELEIIQSYLPEQLTDQEIKQLIEQAINQTQAESVRDMGKVMGILKTQIQGRADMAKVSQAIKDRLSA